MNQADLAAVLLYLHRLHATLRAGWVDRRSANPQSSGDHILMLVGAILLQGYLVGLKAEKVLKDALMALTHDWDEFGLAVDETPYELPSRRREHAAFFGDPQWVKPAFIRSTKGAKRRFEDRRSYLEELLAAHQVSPEVKKLVVDLWSEYNDPSTTTQRALRVRNLHVLSDALEAVVEREWTPKMFSTDSFLDQALAVPGLSEAVAIVAERHRQLTH